MWFFTHSQFSFSKNGVSVALYSGHYTCPLTEVHTFSIKFWINGESVFRSCQGQGIFLQYLRFLQKCCWDNTRLKGTEYSFYPPTTTITLVPLELCCPGQPYDLPRNSYGTDWMVATWSVVASKATDLLVIGGRLCRLSARDRDNANPHRLICISGLLRSAIWWTLPEMLHFCRWSSNVTIYPSVGIRQSTGRTTSVQNSLFSIRETLRSS
jgi:hypothetical protein